MINTEELANDVADIATKAMQRAWLLGQTYWQQANSDSYIQHRKSDVTEATYWQAKDDVRLAIIAAIIKGVNNERVE